MHEKGSLPYKSLLYPYTIFNYIESLIKIKLKSSLTNNTVYSITRNENIINNLCLYYSNKISGTQMCSKKSVMSTYTFFKFGVHFHFHSCQHWMGLNVHERSWIILIQFDSILFKILSKFIKIFQNLSKKFKFFLFFLS